MKQLPISSELSLPLDAATQTFAFIARKGAGKTYAAGKLAECMLDAGIQVVILDSVGNWWGLRLSADGKSPAYDVPVIGGLRGDIPLEATGGHLIADIITETGRSLIIDISQFSKADRQKFSTAFAQRLWQSKKAERHPSPIHLIIEESQLIVPESVKGDVATMVGIYEEIIRLGRNYGIGVSMITQRPQSVNKEVLNQTECLFVLQVNGAHERKALGLWIVFQGMDKSLLDELPSLPVGTAYVWSPQWLGILQKVKVGQKKSFDASATPKVGSTQVRRDLKPLNLDDLKDRMAATIEKAKAEDPRELRKTIAELKKQISKAAPVIVKPVETIKTVEKFVLKDGQLTRAEKLLGSLETVASEIRAALGKVSTNGHKPIAPAVRPQRAAQFPVPVRESVQHKASSVGSGALPEGESKILSALIQYPDGLERTQIGILSGYSKRSTRDTYIARLAAKGYADNRSGKVYATDEGIAALPDAEPLPTGFELQQHWLTRLPEGERKILDYLLNAFPNPVDRDQIGEDTGYDKRSTRDAYIARLSLKQLVSSSSNGVKASDVLFG